MQQIIENGKSGSEDIVDISHYLEVLKQNWLKIVIFASMVTLLTILVVLQISPKYTATATLLIEPKEKKAISIEDVVGINPDQKEYLQTQFEILKSNQIAENVIQKLNLTEIPEFNDALVKKESLLTELKSIPLIASLSSKHEEATPEQIAEATRQRVLSAFKKKLSIDPIRNTQLVRISFTSSDPKLAAKVANAVGYAYVEQTLDARLSVTKYAASWITSRLVQLRTQLSDSEKALSAYLAKEKLIDDSGIDALASEELSDLTKQLSEVRDQRIQVESAYDALRTTNAHDISSISSIPSISSHPEVVAIRAAELDAQNEVKELSKRYGPKHDKMIAAQARLAAVEAQAAKAVRRLIGGFGKQLQALRKQESLLQKTINQKRDAFQNLSVKRSRYDSLKNEVETNREVLNLFLTRQKETKATEDFNATSARFTDEALVPLSPSAPKKRMIIVLAFIASLGLAIILVFIIDAMKSTIESVKNFEDKFGLIPLGGVPMVKSRRFKKKPLDSSVMFDEQEDAFGESIRSIRTSLMLNNQHNKCLTITSSQPSEGKTTIAISIALAFSKLEKVLLIDCDLRKSAVAERFNLKKFQQGLANYLVMDTDLEDCLYPDERSGLTVLPAGMNVTSAQELLSSPKFAELLNSLEQKFDRIIIDTPPSLPVSDSLIVGQLTKSALIVVKANETKFEAIKKTFSKLVQHQIHIDGVVVNQVNHKFASVDYAYGEYGYGESK